MTDLSQQHDIDKPFKTLVIGYVWPEPNSSAAGQHMADLLEGLQALSTDVTFVSPAKLTPHQLDLTTQGITCLHFPPNDTRFDDFLEAYQPTLVMFDRFMMEEQFGWRVKEHAPDAMRVLDSEDLFLVRKGREAAFKAKREFGLEDLNSELACREIAAIYRCDLTLVMSTYEMNLLTMHYRIDEALLHYCPLMIETEQRHQPIAFEQTQDMVMIGNFLHPPNWDAVQWLYHDIWPLLRQALPDVNLYIYGAYTPDKAMQFNQPKKGFHICGRAETLEEVYKNKRLNLAPLRFGAGLKGKILEGMFYGVPIITTPIGSEGIEQTGTAWPGGVALQTEEIVQQIISVYQSPERWEGAVAVIQQTLQMFEKRTHMQSLQVCLLQLRDELATHRAQNFMGIMMTHHSVQSTRYMSKWIEAKNKLG